eukprot:TRINITY_DN17104_c0_g1_i1.p1 TRINITY_DN17104_c0_g1~~TRINITY_DN17104_c0_g1_i1.p1  ORF type:complete len:178 (+),score=10.55 TRINITY_DN17104_c0_g1_i1:45-578(+)
MARHQNTLPMYRPAHRSGNPRATPALLVLVALGVLLGCGALYQYKVGRALRRESLAQRDMARSMDRMVADLVSSVELRGEMTKQLRETLLSADGAVKVLQERAKNETAALNTTSAPSTDSPAAASETPSRETGTVDTSPAPASSGGTGGTELEATPAPTAAASATGDGAAPPRLRGT